MQTKKSLVLVLLLCIFASLHAASLNFTLEPNLLEAAKLNYGQPIKVTARFENDISNIKNLELTMFIPEVNQKKYFSRVAENTFVLNATMPKMRNLKTITLVFEAKGYKNDVEVFTSNSRPVRLTDEIKLKLIEPTSGSAIISSPLDKIKIKANYIDGSPMEEKTLPANLFVDGKKIQLEFSKENDHYVAELPEPVPVGEHEISVKVYGLFRGEDSTKTQPNVILSSVLLSLSFVLSFIVAIGFLWFVLSYLKRRTYLAKQRPVSGTVKGQEIIEVEKAPKQKMQKKEHIEEFTIEAPSEEPEVVVPKEAESEELEVREVKTSKIETKKQQEFKESTREATQIAAEEKQQAVPPEKIKAEEPQQEIKLPEAPPSELKEAEKQAVPTKLEKQLGEQAKEEQKPEMPKGKGLFPLIPPKKKKE
ncbi:MAG: hypothetical protein J7J87_02765 [Candidatus Diapherotrites archaeon]|nr:hypothetical protein [Candidatus Diapherotrites archaeon]